MIDFDLLFHLPIDGVQSSLSRADVTQHSKTSAIRYKRTWLSAFKCMNGNGAEQATPEDRTFFVHFYDTLLGSL